MTTIVLQHKNEFLITEEKKFQKLHSKGFGETKEGMFILNSYETLYLFEKKKIIFNKEITFEQLLKKTKTKLSQYLVYKELKEKGYRVKTGLKFGSDFRVYSKETNGSMIHADWLVIIKHQKDKVSTQELFSQNRVAHTTKKKLILALVDDDYSISFLELTWKKF